MKKKVFSFILASLLLLVQLPTALAAAPTDPLALDNIYTEAKYSLQGTTQGRHLTGGVPPVRFSM